MTQLIRTQTDGTVAAVIESRAAILKAVEAQESQSHLSVPSSQQDSSLEASTSQRSFESASSHDERNKANSIIDSLRFSEMRVRRDEIAEAARTTFGWIFSERSSNFQRWLRSDGSLFWITGKAASGKSTLMKFLTSHPKTVDLLLDWADPSRIAKPPQGDGEQAGVSRSSDLPYRNIGANMKPMLIDSLMSPSSLHIVDAYFWYIGTPLQTSEIGLLRTLLYQILEAYPFLVRLAAARRWRKDAQYHRNPDQWTREELAQSLSAIATERQLPFRCCVFIDGLDEYHGDNGSYQRLIDLVKALSRSPHFKVCVSSRPWTVFETAFRHEENMLRLENLNKADIRKYVTTTINRYIRVHEDQDAKALVSEITSKANGVFLWVYLVVESVIRGLNNDDSLATLHRRIQDFPSDLEKYFRHILTRVDTIYRRQTGQALKLAMLLCNPASEREVEACFIDFWLLKQDEPSTEDEAYAFKIEPKEYPIDRMMAMQQETRDHLSACTRDLLYIPNRHGGSHPIFYPKVEHLHRTVYDFLNTEEPQQLLDQNIPDHFLQESFLSRILLARLAIMPCERITGCYYFQKEASTALRRPVIYPKLVQGFETLGVQYQRRFCSSRCACWSHVQPLDSDLDTLLYTFTAYQCNSYVKQILAWEPGWARRKLHGSSSLLAAALGLSDVHPFPLHLADLEFLESLLEKYAGLKQYPGLGMQHSWHEIANAWREETIAASSQSDHYSTWKVAKLMIKYGADPSQERSALRTIAEAATLPQHIATEIELVLADTDRWRSQNPGSPLSFSVPQLPGPQLDFEID